MQYGRKAAWAVAALALLAGGCQRQDTERLARVGRKVVEKFIQMGSRAQVKLPGGLSALPLDSSVEGRVSARLRWDKALSGTDIRVTAEGSTVALKGTVVSSTQKRRAAELAGATLGVEQVDESQLVVVP